MQFITFPNRLDAIRERLAIASIYRSQWGAVLSNIESMVDGTIASIETRVVRNQGDDHLSSEKGTRPSRRCIGTRLDDLSIDPLCYPEGSVFPLSEWAHSSLSHRMQREREAGADAYGIGLVLNWTGAVAQILTVHVPFSLSEYCGPAVAANIRKISTDVCQAFALSHDLAPPSQPDRSALETMWDRLSIGVALFNSRLECLVSNIAADDVLTSRRYFAPLVEGSKLKATDAADNDRLWQAAERVLYGSRTRECFSIEGFGGSERLPIVFEAVGLSGADWSQVNDVMQPVGFIALIGSWNAANGIGGRVCS